MVVYRGWFGQLGKIAPLVMIISEPQQTLLYAPNPSLISPFCGTVSDAPKSRACVHLCTLAHIGLTLTTTHFEWLIGGIGLPLGPMSFTGQNVHPGLPEGGMAYIKRFENAADDEYASVWRDSQSCPPLRGSCPSFRTPCSPFGHTQNTYFSANWRMR